MEFPSGIFLKKNFFSFLGNEGDGFEKNATCSQFTISIVLTQSGFQAIDQVLIAVFSYLKMLIREGPNERIFNEIKEIDDLNFKFKEESQPMDNVESLCENMHIYPPELILSGPELMFDYDPELLGMVSHKMSLMTIFGHKQKCHEI